MHSCCHIFCELCWKECQKHDARCPICRDTEQPVARAYRCRKDIEKQQLRCPRKCGAIFSLVENHSLLQHLEECPFKPDGCNLGANSGDWVWAVCPGEGVLKRPHSLAREVQVLTASREWKHWEFWRTPTLQVEWKVSWILRILFLFRTPGRGPLRSAAGARGERTPRAPAADRIFAGSPAAPPGAQRDPGLRLQSVARTCTRTFLCITGGPRLICQSWVWKRRVPSRNCLFNQKPNADYSGDLISELRTGSQTLTIFDITLVAPDGANPHPMSCNDWFVIFRGRFEGTCTMTSQICEEVVGKRGGWKHMRRIRLRFKRRHKFEARDSKGISSFSP